MKAPEENNENAINRRKALEKLAKCSVYTAPTVVALLAASSSYAQGSLTTIQCSGFDNRNPMNPMYPEAQDAGGNMKGGPDTTADCGNIMG